MTPALSLTGFGVRHAGHRGEAAGDRGRGAGRNRFLVLLPRLAQVHVHVDETRDRSRAGRNVDDLGAVGERPQIAADLRDAIAVDQDVEIAVACHRPDRRPGLP